MPTKRYVSKPDTVRVLHRAYEVKWLLDIEWKGAGLDMDLRGYSDHSTQFIAVRLEMEGEPVHKDGLQEVFLHELLHAVHNSTMIWNSWDDMPSKDYSTIDELFVGFASPVLLNVMRDNPDVVKWVVS
jgi:hypothetical protein